MGKKDQNISRKFYRTENKYDPYLTKDQVTSFISDELRTDPQIQEKFNFQNFKVVLGLLIVCIVVFSHYHFVPWPDDYFILMASIVLYYTTTYIYTQYEKKTEKDIFFLFKDHQDHKTYGFGAVQELQSKFIDLRIVHHETGNELIKQTINIADYFDTYGYLDKVKMNDLMKQMVTQAKEKVQ